VRIRVDVLLAAVVCAPCAYGFTTGFTTGISGFASRDSRARVATRSAFSLRSPRQAARGISQVCATSDYDILKDLRVPSVSSDQERAVVKQSGRQLLVLLTHFGDLSSWEYAQQLRFSLPALQEQGVEVVAVGIGGKEAAKKFAKLNDFPEELLYYDEQGACCAAMGCSAGFGRDSPLQAQSNALSPYLRLLPMLLGVGSPGTLQKVIYGYFGDREWDPQWIKAQLALTATGDFPYVQPQMFDKVGKGYLRPFELATVRLQNMIGILNNWFELIPSNADLVVQQGATLVLDNGSTLYKFQDKGILVYGGDKGVRSIEHVLLKAQSPASESFGAAAPSATAPSATDTTSLPGGWFAAVDEPTGKPYYYTAEGAVTWERPTASP